MSEDVFSRNQSFQQAIATTITCRTIIKYNSNLSEEQKAEILGEIESTLGFLEKRLGSTLENDSTLIPEKPLDSSTNAADEERAPAGGQEDRYISLQNLYRLHQSYLSNKPGRGIAALETRYRTVMGVLDQVQELAGQNVAPGNSDVERLLGRVRGFVTALYCMFREFALLLSNIVDGKTIDMDTEALALLPKHSLALLQEQRVRDITPLIEVYGKHLRLQERKGALTACAREAGALLVFLEENLSQTFARRKEIAAQIKTIAGLLNELTDLLTDYGQAIANIIQSPSASL
jgi:hypothetical protein